MEFPVVTAISANSSVDIHGCLDGMTWCDVSAAGTRGWVSASYLAHDMDGQRMVLPEASVRIEVPTVQYDTATYWDDHYRDQAFYAERDQWISGGATTGVLGGAAVGALAGGPVGAIIGGVAGGAIGAAIEPPSHVDTYVTEQRIEPVQLEGEVRVGAGLPDMVTLHPIPDYEYRYAMVNGQRVLVDPGDRTIVHIY